MICDFRSFDKLRMTFVRLPPIRLRSGQAHSTALRAGFLAMTRGYSAIPKLRLRLPARIEPCRKSGKDVGDKGGKWGWRAGENIE